MHRLTTFNVVSLSAAVVLFAAACKQPESAEAARQKPAAPSPVFVDTARVELVKMPRFLTLTGNITADRQSEVAANVSGRIVYAAIERGQAIKEGQTLAVVDSRSAGFSATAASSQAKASETQGAQAQADCDRADQLLAQSALSQAEHGRLKNLCTAQLYAAGAARANADLAAKLAGDTTIKAPFSGLIGERYVNLGEYVQPPTRVASLYALDSVRVSISVPEIAVALIRPGQTLDVRVSAFPGRVFPAEVKFVAPALRPGTRDLVVEARAENKDAALRPGMFATVLLRVGEEERPTVPADALRDEGTVHRLFLAREGQAFELVVGVGVTVDGRTAVLEALDDTAIVIRRPPPGLRDGASIRIGTAAGDAPAAVPTPRSGN